jgi:hypothetical protein
MRVRTLSLVPAMALVLVACGSSTAKAPPATVPTASTVVVSSTQPPVTEAETTTTASPTTAAPTTTEAAPVAPPALVSAHPHGSQPDEGHWTVLYSLGDRPVMWSTWVRPVPENVTSLAWAAVFDQHRLSAALYNGIEQPGGTNWRYRARIAGAEVPAVVASFNGGFDFHNAQDGYLTEGRYVRPMRDGRATLGIDKAGVLTLGVYGRTITDDGSWVSLRQNLPPLVLEGKSVIDDYPGTYWGDNFGGVTATFRSAVCTIADGRLMYVAMGKQTIRQFVNGLVRMGCITGMELDNNGSWVRFFTYDGLGTAVRRGIALDPRMGQRQLDFRSMRKEMFVLFDPSLRPAS